MISIFKILIGPASQGLWFYKKKRLESLCDVINIRDI